jgi:hypothetical protein
LILFLGQDEITLIEIMRDITEPSVESKYALIESRSKRVKSVSDEKTEGSAVTCTTSIQIRTVLNGFNSGRIYYLQSDSAESCAEMVQCLQKIVGVAKARAEKASKFRKSQKQLRTIYDSQLFQLLSSFLIVSVISCLVFFLTFEMIFDSCRISSRTLL